MSGVSTVEGPAGGGRQQSAFRLGGPRRLLKAAPGRECLPHAGHFEAKDFPDAAQKQTPSRCSC
jgi:hypothetical protein